MLDWCRARGVPPPQIEGIEQDPGRAAEARARFACILQVRILEDDFLWQPLGPYQYIVGNPPYVPITRLSEEEKTAFRDSFDTARGRFDLYVLFFEHALRMLSPDGRLVLITPEKYLYVETTRPLRRILARHAVQEVHFLPEDTFSPLTTYPVVTTVDAVAPTSMTRIYRRDGTVVLVQFPLSGDSLMAAIQGEIDHPQDGTVTLGDLCTRISAGVATGADRVFIRRRIGLDRGLLRYAHPTLSGRQLHGQREPLACRDILLVPYDDDGFLLPFEELGELRDLLLTPEVRRQLMVRTCAERKPWYAFHETPPLQEILRPKLLCKDVAATPHFWSDPDGGIVPRHSTYYIVPRDPDHLPALQRYLNSEAASRWMTGHCVRAANNYLRLQSRVVRKLPVPLDVLTMGMVAAGGAS